MRRYDEKLLWVGRITEIRYFKNYCSLKVGHEKSFPNLL